MNSISKAAAIMGAKGGKAGVGPAKRRTFEHYQKASSKRWSFERAKKRFWNRVDKKGPDECWLWLGKRNRDGYGMFRLPRSPGNAHRLVYELTNGPIQGGLCVCHKCDNPACCNPNHLFLATNAENTADSKRKGRRANGERNNHHKLSEARVREIKRLLESKTMTQRAIAEKFGVTQSAIWPIAHGKTWKHIV